MLWRENHKSINYRYALRDRTPSYTYRAPQEFQTAKNDWYPDRPLVDRALLAKQISCYDYQTCEHPTYYRSRAYSVVQSMSNALLHHVEGYEDAPWGVE